MVAPLTPKLKWKAPPLWQAKTNAITVTSGTKARLSSAWPFLGLEEALSSTKVDNRTKRILRWRSKCPRQITTARLTKVWRPVTPTARANIPVLPPPRRSSTTTPTATTSTVTSTAATGVESRRGRCAPPRDLPSPMGPRWSLPDQHLRCQCHASAFTPRSATTTTLPPRSPRLAPKRAKSPRVALVLQVHLYPPHPDLTANLCPRLPGFLPLFLPSSHTQVGWGLLSSTLLPLNLLMKWGSRDTEPITSQPRLALGHGDILTTDSDTYAHLPVKCPRKITLCDDKPFTGRQKVLSAKRVLVSVSERRKSSNLLPDWQISGLWCWHLFIFCSCVELLLGFPSLRTSQGMCETGGCLFSFGQVGFLRPPYGETKVLVLLMAWKMHFFIFKWVI